MHSRVRIIELASIGESRRDVVATLLAGWHIAEFGHLYSPDVWNRDVARTEFLAMAQAGCVPTTWLAIESNGGDDSGEIDDVGGFDEGLILGSVSLIASDDLAGYEHVGPWLASLYIRPEARSRGIGRLLCDHLLGHALSIGFDEIFLFTQGQERYYLNDGWRTVGHASANGHQAAVMKRRTSDHAARRATASQWSTNPDVGGAYSYVRVGGTTQLRAAFDGEVLPRVWFAGEHTSIDHPATMHGAWFSGERAARQIVSTVPTGASVLVIGAGLAGLVAGRALHAAGLVVTIIDSADHLGGRARVDRSIGIPVPLGGAWLHGTDGHPLVDLVRSRPDDWRDIRTVAESIGPVDPEFVHAAEALFARFLVDMEQSAATWSVAQSFDHWKQSHRSVERVTGLVLDHLARTYFENLYAAPMQLASAAHVHEDYELAGGNAFITSDLGPVLDGLATGLDVRLGVRVRTMRLDDDGRWHSDVGVQTDCVLATVPIGALRAQRVAFDPVLPSTVLGAIDGLDAGPVCKVFSTHDSRWWDDGSAAGQAAIRLIGDPDPLPFVIVTDVSELTGTPTLMWFAIGDDARRAELMSEDELCALVDDVAARCLIARAPNS